MCNHLRLASQNVPNVGHATSCTPLLWPLPKKLRYYDNVVLVDTEIAVEKLCSMFEQEDHSTMDVEYIKTKVQDLTRYCNKRRQALIDHVEEGTDKGNCWVYIEPGCD